MKKKTVLMSVASAVAILASFLFVYFDANQKVEKVEIEIRQSLNEYDLACKDEQSARQIAAVLPDIPEEMITIEVIESVTPCKVASMKFNLLAKDIQELLGINNATFANDSFQLNKVNLAEISHALALFILWVDSSRVSTTSEKRERLADWVAQEIAKKYGGQK